MEDLDSGGHEVLGREIAQNVLHMPLSQARELLEHPGKYLAPSDHEVWTPSPTSGDQEPRQDYRRGVVNNSEKATTYPYEITIVPPNICKQALARLLGRQPNAAVNIGVYKPGTRSFHGE